MIKAQGVMVGKDHVGVVEGMPNGRFRAHSTVTGMGETFARMDSAIWFLADSAKATGMTGDVRAPEHLMELGR